MDNGYGRYDEQEFSDGEIDYQEAYRGNMMDFDEYQAGGGWSYDMQVRPLLPCENSLMLRSQDGVGGTG